MSEQKPEDYAMTYSVTWIATDAPFATRFDRYLDFDFFEHQIRWFSIFNSFMMVVFMCGVVALILMRVLKADYARYITQYNTTYTYGAPPAAADAATLYIYIYNIYIYK